MVPGQRFKNIPDTSSIKVDVNADLMAGLHPGLKTVGKGLKRGLAGRFVLGLIALVIAVPLGMVAGYGLAEFTANMMSVDLQGFRVIPAATVLQVIVALGVPMAAGYFPVNQGAKTTVRRAISQDGPGEQGAFEVPGAAEEERRG